MTRRNGLYCVGWEGVVESLGVEREWCGDSAGGRIECWGMGSSYIAVIESNLRNKNSAKNSASHSHTARRVCQAR